MTQQWVVNDGPGLLVAHLMYSAVVATKCGHSPPAGPQGMVAGRNQQDYPIESKYISAGEKKEFTLHQFQYLVVEEVHP